jgi:tetratricopeptide (TPR) repeat protein
MPEFLHACSLRVGGLRRLAGACAAAILLSVGTLQAQMQSPAESLEKARQLAASNQLAQANEMLAAMVSRDPQNLPAWQLLGDVQLAQSLYNDAMNSFETVLRAHPDAATPQGGEVRAAIAEALADRNTGNPDRALATLSRARRYAPKSPELLMDFGIQADSMQIYRDAEDALLEAHRLDPENAKVLYALAHVELDEQKTAEAETDLRAYLKIMPQDASAHYGLGHLLYMTLKDQQARAELECSIALQPRQTESYYELGQIALDSHDDGTAKEDYLKVLAAAPNHGGALTGMGVLAFRAKDYDSAAKYLKQAVIFAPEYVTAHRYYAMTLARLGLTQQSHQEETTAQQLTEEQNRLRHGYTLRAIP